MKFTPETRVEIYDRLARGMSLAETSQEVGVSLKTVKSWLTRGRRGEDDFREFALVADRLREVELPEDRLDLDGLIDATSRSARRGSVQAQKLLFTMLTARNDDGDESPEGPLDEIDEIARKRAAKTAAHR